MRRASLVLLAVLLLPLGGCLKKTLRHPAEDHHVQTKAVAASCEADGYGNGKCTQDDLDAMAKQAECIDAIVKGEDCDDAPAADGGEEGGGQ